MEHGTFGEFKRLLNALGAYRRRGREEYSDGCILAVHFFATLHDRPVSWACVRDHMPASFWRGALPDQTTMSRRMARPHMAKLLARVETLLTQTLDRPPSVVAIDGKPLTIALHSADPHAGFGRGVRSQARGYKIHAVVDASSGKLLDWRLAGLDRDERIIARRLVRDLPRVRYLLGDTNYDSNELHRLARQRGVQLLAPRKRSHRGGGLGHGEHDPGRLRCIRLLEQNPPAWITPLLRLRTAVERVFANLSNFAGGLTGLPPWVRTYPRVLAWVRAKLIIALLRGSVVAARVVRRA